MLRQERSCQQSAAGESVSRSWYSRSPPRLDAIYSIRDGLFSGFSVIHVSSVQHHTESNQKCYSANRKVQVMQHSRWALGLILVVPVFAQYTPGSKPQSYSVGNVLFPGGVPPQTPASMA